jgi:hypothetical protein
MEESYLMLSVFSESVVEDAALACLEGLDYTVTHGSEIAPGELLFFGHNSSRSRDKRGFAAKNRSYHASRNPHLTIGQIGGRFGRHKKPRLRISL